MLKLSCCGLYVLQGVQSVWSYQHPSSTGVCVNLGQPVICWSLGQAGVESGCAGIVLLQHHWRSCPVWTCFRHGNTVRPGESTLSISLFVVSGGDLTHCPVRSFLKRFSDNSGVNVCRPMEPATMEH